MTLTLHHGPGTGPLADALAGLLAEPLDDPFAEEVVVVPAKGVERWLTQRLSHRLGAGPSGQDGICAGVRFLNPRSLVALLTGTEDDDPWDPDRLVWPLLDVIDDSLAEPWCATLAWHLGHGQETEEGVLRRDRRWSVARRLAGLFASYAVQRPALLTEWREGRATDGAGGALPDDLAWQAHLWRALLERVPAPPPDVRHTDTLQAIRDGKPLAMPDRLSMFGHTRMPVTELELLRAVGEVREVHLWLPQVSAASWQRLAEPTAEGRVRRRDDATARLVQHRLLASLGRDARELQRSLTVLGAREEDVVTGHPRDHGSLLQRLQHDLRSDSRSEPGPVAADDRSVQVHSCHGPARQVEVLREVLAGLMEDDPTLEPRDVLVMCPDVEAYAPLFSAAFALGEVLDDVEAAHPGHRLRVRLADRGLSGTNPLLALAGSLVHLAGGRATASEVLDLVSSAPVRHRFGLDDDEVAEVVGWVRRSGIRWGLDSDLRSAYGLEGFAENTWSAGLDRVLLGVAAAEGDAVLGGRVPLDEIGSADVDLAGRLAELVERLRATVVTLRAADTVASWLAALRAGVAGLGSVPPSLAWQEAQLERELDEVADAADRAGGSGGTLSLADVRTLLDLRLQPRPTRANFRTGHVTVCTMVPMRSVPHRVVCLVGLDDGVFPRSTVPDGDDVLQRDPMTGERDTRSEDRQLLLDAVLAAEEHLVVTYTGRSVNNNQERPPAVPLDELLDALGELAPGAREAVVREHPLQSFDPRNFVTDDRSSAPFSFDVRAAQAARAFQGERRRPAPFLTAPLDGREPGDVDLADLQAFYRHPVAGFLRQGLDVALPEQHDETDDAVPLALDHLEDWALGDRVLRRIIDGEEPQAVLTAELLRGDLPPRELGQAKLRDVCGKVQALAEESADDRATTPTTVDVTVDLGDGRRLTGVVPDVRGQRIVRVHFSKLSAKHRLQAWIDLLALCAARPDQGWTARTFGRFKKYGREGVAWSLLHVEPDEALTFLRRLVEVRDRGLREPLPLFAKTSPAYAARFRKDGQGEVDAGRAWRTSDRFPGEDADPAHVLVHGAGTELDRLMGLPDDDERWFDHEPTRLGQYALHVWTPLLEHEKGRNL